MSTKTTDKSTPEEPKTPSENLVADPHLTPDSQTLQELEAPPNPEGLVQNEISGPHTPTRSAKIESLQQQLKDINQLLAWKEDLKLLSLHATINAAYSQMWQREINPLVKRSVILKRRLKQYQAAEKYDQESESEDRS